MAKRWGAALTAMDALPTATVTADSVFEMGLMSAPVTELGAQAILALRRSKTGEPTAPSCFERKFGPTDQRCTNCLFNAKCWSGDRRYLRELEAGIAPAPAYVPQSAIEAALRGDRT